MSDGRRVRYEERQVPRHARALSNRETVADESLMVNVIGGIWRVFLDVTPPLALRVGCICSRDMLLPLA